MLNLVRFAALAYDTLGRLQDAILGPTVAPERFEQLAPFPGLMEKTDAAFRDELVRVAERIHVEPNWLAAILCFESAGSWSPKIRNPMSGAVGILQWLAPAAGYCGTTQAKLARMSNTRQLTFVFRYFEHFAGRIASLPAMYGLVLGGALYHGNATIMFTKNSIAYRQNRSLDREGKGYITTTDAASGVLKLLRDAMKLRAEQSQKTPTASPREA